MMDIKIQHVMQTVECEFTSNVTQKNKANKNSMLIFVITSPGPTNGIIYLGHFCTVDCRDVLSISSLSTCSQKIKNQHVFSIIKSMRVGRIGNKFSIWRLHISIDGDNETRIDAGILMVIECVGVFDQKNYEIYESINAFHH